jgi:hypothetical protein
MQYLKYEFQDIASWLEKKETIWSEETGYANCHVIEVGNITLTPGTYDEEGNVITEPVTTGKHAIDIVWNESEDSSFAAFKVWPAPCGVHTVSGLEGLYEAAYYEQFPELKPTIDSAIDPTL